MAGEKATRDAYGEALVEIGETNERVVVLDADLSKSTKSWEFGKRFPDRFFNVGIAEQNLMSVAAGLATCGKIPFASTFAVFASGRAYDQVRMCIAYPRLNVKIGASHSGITVGEDGASHQALEDISLMRTLPNMTVVVPADATETRAVVKAAVDYDGPMYIRLGRAKVPTIYDANHKFDFGRAHVLREGNDVALLACGPLVGICLQAANLLEKEGINATVVNVSTIKPLDRQVILEVAARCRRVVTAEDHSIVGGLGSAVAEALSEEMPVYLRRVGVPDKFGESGNAEELLSIYGMDVNGVCNTVRDIMLRTT